MRNRDENDKMEKYMKVRRRWQDIRDNAGEEKWQEYLYILPEREYRKLKRLLDEDRHRERVDRFLNSSKSLFVEELQENGWKEVISKGEPMEDVDLSGYDQWWEDEDE